MRPFAQGTPVLELHQDAFIEHSDSSNAWFIGNSGAKLEVGFTGSGTLSMLRLWNPLTKDILALRPAPDVSVTLNGTQVPLALSNAAITFLGASTVGTDFGVQLVFSFQHRSTGAIIRRYFACYPLSPTFETWTRIEVPARGPAVQVSNLTAWQFTMPAAPIRWINGLRSGNVDALVPESFNLGGRELQDGEAAEIGSDRRSSEQFVPLVLVNDGSREFYGGIAWSGAWRIGLTRSGDDLTVNASFPDTSTAATPDRPVELPHAFFGFTTHTATMGTSTALREFLLRGIRKGRMFRPLVTYNTWFPYGAYVNESDVDSEMQRAATLGVELFVLDAGWYEGTGAAGKGDYTSGLGSWKVDEVRFPSRLVGMADRAHELGMKFGLWVEPERIALGLIDQPGLAEEGWLATLDGSYGLDGESGQICLASAVAREWVLQRLVELIETVHPDYLKWDNNSWTNCNREGHDHGPADGNFAHVSALYGLLDEIRQRYPALLIENVSGGGNRLDYGMAAYTDAAWMDDSTSPSEHVRHNLQGLSLAFPPAYLLSFVVDSESESFRGGELPHIVRSRMPGILGLAYRVGEVEGDVSTVLAKEVASYKLLRDTITQASAFLLGDQAPVEAEGWDVVQEISEDRRNAIVFAFKNNSSEGRLLLRPRNLLPDTIYDVSSLDYGAIGSATGAELMQDGVELVHPDGGSRAHLLTFDPQPPPEPDPPPQEEPEAAPSRRAR